MSRNRAPGPQQRGVQPWRTVRFLIPPARDASYVAAMEVVLDTHAEPVNPAVPMVCFDEAGKELQGHGAGREPLPAQPGTLLREDPEYVRQGSVNLFLVYAPHLGWRQVTVTTQRTAVDWAFAMRDLVDVQFPDAARTIVVLDTLNTHRLSSLDTAFPAPEAHRIARTFEVRFTPKHGSWLNMAEGELAVLSSQCLDRRIPNRATLATEVAAWERDRNAEQVTVDWQFTTADARIKLKRLYPVLRPVAA